MIGNEENPGVVAGNCVAIIGSFTNGFRVVGPFNGGSPEVYAWLDKEGISGDFTIVQSPETYEREG